MARGFYNPGRGALLTRGPEADLHLALEQEQHEATQEFRQLHYQLEIQKLQEARIKEQGEVHQMILLSHLKSMALKELYSIVPGEKDARKKLSNIVDHFGILLGDKSPVKITEEVDKLAGFINAAESTTGKQAFTEGQTEFREAGRQGRFETSQAAKKRHEDFLEAAKDKVPDKYKIQHSAAAKLAQFASEQVAEDDRYLAAEKDPEKIKALTASRDNWRTQAAVNDAKAKAIEDSIPAVGQPFVAPTTEAPPAAAQPTGSPAPAAPTGAAAPAPVVQSALQPSPKSAPVVQSASQPPDAALEAQSRAGVAPEAVQEAAARTAETAAEPAAPTLTKFTAQQDGTMVDTSPGVASTREQQGPEWPVSDWPNPSAEPGQEPAKPKSPFDQQWDDLTAQMETARKNADLHRAERDKHDALVAGDNTLNPFSGGKLKENLSLSGSHHDAAESWDTQYDTANKARNALLEERMKAAGVGADAGEGSAASEVAKTDTSEGSTAGGSFEAPHPFEGQRKFQKSTGKYGTFVNGQFVPE